MTKKFLRWVFGSALITRDKAISILQTENRELAMELALVKARKHV